MFVPFLALALELLYVRQKVLYIDHLVFALHFQSALFLALTLVGVANRLGLRGLTGAVGGYVAVCLLGAPIYLALALRRRYRQGWPPTLAKTALLGVLYMAILTPVVGVTLGVVISSI